MGYDHTETQQGIETCFFKKPKLFFNDRAWARWLSTTLERSDESKRASMLQKLREAMQSTEIVTKVAAATKFILQYTQNPGDKKTALGAFINLTTQQAASHSEMPREQSFRRKRDMSDACNLLLPHVPEDKATLLRTLSEDMLQQSHKEISEIIDPQERLQAISSLPREESYQLYAELALKEDIPIALRREAFFYIFYFIDSLDKNTREGLRKTFLNDEALPFDRRLALLPRSGEETPPVATLLSFARALESADDKSYSEWGIRRLTELLMDYDHTEKQKGIETCFFKLPRIFLDGYVREKWLRTTLEMSDKSKRASILQKLREAMHSAENVTRVANTAKFILKHSQNVSEKEAALETFLNIAAQQNANHSEMPREQSFRRKLDISHACKTLLPHVPEDKAALLRTLSEEMLQQVCAEISAIIDPQERLKAISTLLWGEQNRKLRDKLLIEFALQEDIPIALRREALSSIYSTDSLDEATKERLKSLRISFLNDEDLPFKDRLAFLPDSEEEAPPIATLLSLMRAQKAEDRDSSDSDNSETSYSSSDLDDGEYDPETDYSLESYDDEIYDDNGRSYKYRLYRFLTECLDPGVQQGLGNYYFNHPIAAALYLKKWLNDFYKRSDESQKNLILQKMQETMQTTNTTRNILVAAKFLLIHSQDHELAIQALEKLVEEQTSKGSEISKGEGEEEGEEDYGDYEKKMS